MRNLLIVTVLMLSTAAVFAQGRTCSPGGTKQVACKCWNGTHTITETTWTDSFGRTCKVTSEPCTCPPHPQSIVPDMSAKIPK